MMENIDINKILRQSLPIVEEVGTLIKKEQAFLNKNKIEAKNINDFVTDVDKNAEQELVKQLSPLISGAGFITEEKTISTQGDTYNWIIDPLDGTTNYIHQLRPVAVSLALQKEEEIVMGIVYEIGKNEMFYATQGKGAYLNAKEIHTSQTSKVSESLIATGFPYKNFGRMNQFMETLVYYMKNSHGIRRLGSAATDLAYVAAGRFDAFYEYGLSSWDVAAGTLIVKEAGGEVSDFSGNENYINGGEIIASNPNIYNEFLSITSTILNNKSE